MNHPEETFTLAELAGAYRRLGVLDPIRNASQIVESIKAHREPEYEEGAYYMDADGDVFMRVANGWLGIGEEGTLADNYPSRPLRPVTRVG